MAEILLFKKMTKNQKLTLVSFSVAIMAFYFLLKDKKKNYNLGVDGTKDSSNSKDNTPPPNDTKNTQKWVYSVEDGKDYCRWYDRNGKNTLTYNAPCNKAKANMYK